MTQSSEFGTNGRLDRTGFWLRHLFVVPLGLWLVIAAGQTPGPPYDLPVAGACLALLVSTWGRRLHDRGHSAWWLLGVFVPVIGAIALVVECGFRRAAPGAGRFGPVPGARTDYLTVAGAPNDSPARP